MVQVAASAAGKLNLYDDYDCNTPSTLNPTVNLPLSTCLVVTGGEGLVIDSTPACPQGTATLIYYSDPACGVQTTDVPTALVSQNCMQIADGTDLYDAKSVMFSCQPAANNPQPSSTSTAVVSGLAAAATGSNDNGSGSSSSPTSTNAQPSSSSGSGTGGTTITNSNTQSSPSSDSAGLQTGDIVALAVGLGIGIPTIVIMLAAWLMPNFRHKLSGWASASGKKVTPWAFPPQQQQHHNGPWDLPPQQHPYRPPGHMQQQHIPQWQYAKNELPGDPI